MRKFGLIGYPLSHSFSKKYFSEKFAKEGIQNTSYELFELISLNDFKHLFMQYPEICGLNVTIPYKEKIIPYLDKISGSAQEVGAVNVIKVEKDGTLTGYNSDYYGFLESLRNFLPAMTKINTQPSYKALILGSGGASKAVQAVLKAIHIPYLLVSREKSNQSNALIYSEINQIILHEYQLIINTTPLGMSPKTEICPDIPYHLLHKDHFLYDLVYNPEETLFLKKGKEFGAQTKGGLDMLYLQADKAWEIWNS